MWYGAAYYPEHWPEERWGEGVRLMREAGFNVARLAEFAWCRLEPEMDRFDFDWLDRAIETLHAEGILVLLGTPPAGPPAWLVNAPTPELDCRMVYEGGVRWQFGGRSLCCVNHPHLSSARAALLRSWGNTMPATRRHGLAEGGCNDSNNCDDDEGLCSCTCSVCFGNSRGTEGAV